MKSIEPLEKPLEKTPAFGGPATWLFAMGHDLVEWRRGRRFPWEFFFGCIFTFSPIKWKFRILNVLEEYDIYIFDGHSKTKRVAIFQKSKNQQKHKTPMVFREYKPRLLHNTRLSGGPAEVGGTCGVGSGEPPIRSQNSGDFKHQNGGTGHLGVKWFRFFHR